MSRCVICDHCSEIDGGKRKYQWDDKENGYVCSRCTSTINGDLWYSTEIQEDDGEVRDHWIDFDFDKRPSSAELGVPSLLEKSRVEGDAD